MCPISTKDPFQNIELEQDRPALPLKLDEAHWKIVQHKYKDRPPSYSILACSWSAEANIPVSWISEGSV